MRPEIELLLCCARTCVEADTAARVQTLLRRDVDWSYLIQQALWHRVAPLVYRKFRAIDPDSVPDFVLDQLRTILHANAGRNLLMATELLRILNMLEAEGIAAIPYKGPVLAMAVYGNLALRQFSDLDILVRREDILKANALLLAQGYLPWEHPAPDQRAAYFRSNKDFKFLRADGQVSVEVHWKLALRRFSFPFDPEPLWETTEPVSLLNTPVRNLSPENLIIILCANGCKDRWVQLSSVCDVAEFIRTYRDIDWERVMDHTALLRSQRMFFLGLLLAYDLLQAPLPAPVVRKIRADAVVQSLADQVRRWLLGEMHGPRWGIEKTLFRLRMREYWRDSLPSLVHHFREGVKPTMKDEAVVRLPEPFSFLYYVIRPVRLMGKYLRSLISKGEANIV